MSKKLQIGSFKRTWMGFQRGDLLVPKIDGSLPLARFNKYNKGSPDLLLDKATSILPSVPYYLRSRAGMSLKEVELLAQENRIRKYNHVPDGGDESSLLSLEELPEQFSWDEIESWNMEVQTDEGRWVPVLHRQAHRAYAILNKNRNTSLSLNQLDKHSFLHSVPPGSTHAEWVVHCGRGYESTKWSRQTCGLVVLTTDLTWSRYLHNYCIGSGGTYVIQFHRGTPHEIAVSLANYLRSIPDRDASGRYKSEFVTYEVSDVEPHPEDPNKYLLEITLPFFKPAMIETILKHSVDTVTCVRYEGLDLNNSGLRFGEHREMSDEEVSIMERCVRRNKAQVVSMLLR
eukprot:PhF_6_TR39106/c0_g1_i1/m.58529